MMKKSTLTVITLDTFGGILLGLGLCMVLISEWNVFRPGMIVGSLGVAILLVMAVVWKGIENKEPIHLSGRFIGIILAGALGALLSGIALSLIMVWHEKDVAILIGTLGILFCAIPLLKTWK